MKDERTQLKLPMCMKYRFHDFLMETYLFSDLFSDNFESGTAMNSLAFQGMTLSITILAAF